MTKQYKYEEYKKLSDAVRDWESGQQIFHEIMRGVWDLHTGSFHKSEKYYKRVEIKEKTVEAWAVVNNDAEVIALSPDGYFKGGTLPINELLKLVKLTGTIKE